MRLAAPRSLRCGGGIGVPIRKLRREGDPLSRPLGDATTTVRAGDALLNRPAADEGIDGSAQFLPGASPASF
jgi:hypothetical protein